jgi:hypothetical protein
MWQQKRLVRDREKKKKKLLLAEEATTTKKWMKNGANGSHTRVKRRRHFSVGDTGYW